MFRVKRIYDTPVKDDGYRILVIAPSTGLRKWFNHEPEKWLVFKSKYVEELTVNKAVQDLRAACEDKDVVTLLFAARDQHYNHALVLQSFLENELG
nr:DUF488 family protein [Pedobacter panaciterrae]